MLHRSRFARRALLRAAFALLAATHAQAATKTVGGGVSCDFGSIQQALDSLPTSGTHLIRIASDQSYLGIHLDIHDLDVTLEGGYANCSETTPSGSNTTLDASGHSAVECVVIRNVSPARHSDLNEYESPRYSGLFSSSVSIPLRRSMMPFV